MTVFLKCPDMLPSLELEEMVEGIETAKLKTLGRMIVDRFNANLPVTGADLIAETSDSEIRNLVSSLLMDELEGDPDSYGKIVRQYQAHRIKQQIRELSKKIRAAEKANDQELLSELLAEKQKWAQQQLEVH